MVIDLERPRSVECCSNSWESQGANWFAPGNSQKAQELAQAAPSEGEDDGEAEWEVTENKIIIRK